MSRISVKRPFHHLYDQSAIVPTSCTPHKIQFLGPASESTSSPSVRRDNPFSSAFTAPFLNGSAFGNTSLPASSPFASSLPVRNASSSPASSSSSPSPLPTSSSSASSSSFSCLSFGKKRKSASAMDISSPVQSDDEENSFSQDRKLKDNHLLYKRIRHRKKYEYSRNNGKEEEEDEVKQDPFCKVSAKELMDPNATIPNRKKKFTLEEVRIIVSEALAEQDALLREEFSKVLNQRLTEQYDQFAEYSQDFLRGKKEVDSDVSSIYL